jgi:hypothetical protein
LDVLVGGGGVGRGNHLLGDGEVVKGSIRTVKAKFRLEQCGGAVSWKKPFTRSRGNVDLVDSLFSRDKNLQKDFAVRGFFFGLKNMLTGKVPVGKERMRVAWGEKESSCSVTFWQVSKKLEMGDGMRRGFRKKGGKSERVRGRGDGDGSFAKTWKE